MSATIGHDNSEGWIISPRLTERCVKRTERSKAIREAWVEANEEG